MALLFFLSASIFSPTVVVFHVSRMSVSFPHLSPLITPHVFVVSVLWTATFVKNSKFIRKSSLYITLKLSVNISDLF